MKSVKNRSSHDCVKGTSVLKVFIGFILFILLIFSVSGILTTLNPQYRPASTSVNTAASNITGEMLYHLIGWENHYFLQGLPEIAST